MDTTHQRDFVEPFVQRAESGKVPLAHTVWVATETKAGTNLAMMTAEVVAWRGDVQHVLDAGHIHGT